MPCLRGTSPSSSEGGVTTGCLLAAGVPEDSDHRVAVVEVGRHHQSVTEFAMCRLVGIRCRGRTTSSPQLVIVGNCARIGLLDVTRKGCWWHSTMDGSLCVRPLLRYFNILGRRRPYRRAAIPRAACARATRHRRFRSGDLLDARVAPAVSNSCHILRIFESRSGAWARAAGRSGGYGSEPVDAAGYGR
jgi:hypothetical protein